MASIHARDTTNPDKLIVEEGAGTAIFFVLLCLGVGAIGVIIGWTNEKWLFVIVGAIFAISGLKILLLGRTRTHRFERWRAMLAIDSKGLLRSDRRELALANIADIVLEEIRGHGGPSYYLYHVTADGERIKWSDYYEGKANTLACFHAARDFLGIANAPAAVDNEPTSG